MLLFGAAAGQALAAGSLSGTVKVPAGRSMDGALVNATDSSFHDFRSAIDAGGTYSLTGLAPGSYTVVAVGNGMDPGIAANVAIKDGQDVKQDFTLQEAKPYCIVRSPTPIPLTDDYNSASFADAVEFRVDQAWQIVLGIGSGDLSSWDPTQVSGKFKLKYSSAGIHLAADLTFAVPGAHNWPMAGEEIWDGNSFDFDLQNDAYDPNRPADDLDHNWQIIVGLGDTPVWKLFQAGYPPTNQSPLSPPATGYVLRKVKTTNDGELDRIDFPWSLFLQNKSMKGPIAMPPDNTMGAIDIALNGSGPTLSRDHAALKNRLDESGFFWAWNDPRELRPAMFCPQAP
jgi:hypothetical protein